ncbi:MAG: alpha-amylase family glycosyl hydrolase [Flavobacteriaceae bacterium]
MSQLKKLEVEQVKPLHWWVGFESEELQLLVKSNQIQGMKVTVNTPSVEITKVHNADSPNYLFIDLKIKKNTDPGKIQLLFSSQDNESYILDYELKARTKSALDYKGFNSEDAIYLITPDRFANANPGNDIQPNLQEQKINRNDDYARHGGDIQGITDHLDYIHDMGFTAVWSCPLRTNDMKKGSYHGYAITDHYEVDPRFGTMEEFKTLVEEAKKRGIKFIMDQIVNHCGLYHWWMEDLPFKDWINYQDKFLSGKPTKYSNHRRTINQDNYASEIDKKEMTDGWFVETMPDLNHKNPFMAKFIIQNSIWWIEELGLGGIRQDTYPYADKTFLSNWAGAIMNEYPNFSIVGEEWSYNPLLIGYWQNDPKHKQGYVSNLTSTMDFAILENIKKGISQDESWDKGLIKIYDGLANDFNYPNPKGIMAMMDNHDMSRIYTELKGDIIQTKMALSTLLMLPRVPQIYYGTEILMQDFDKPGDHGLVRTDFPGGWGRRSG